MPQKTQWFTKTSPTSTISYSGTLGLKWTLLQKLLLAPPEQTEHIYQWIGEETGSGQMKITSVKPVEEVVIELKFIEPFENIANTQFNLSKEGASTKVTWNMSGENNLMSKWMCLFMSMASMIGKDFENGLKSSKEKSEKQ